DQVATFLESLSGAAHVDKTLDEGDSITFAGQSWRVYHTPGHAGGLLCFYAPAERILLSSDHLLRDISSNPLIEPPEQQGAARPRRLLDYMREMQRLADLDVKVAYTGHGKEIPNVRELVE